jgi:hypothetical protein
VKETLPEKDKYESMQKILLACVVQNDTPLVMREYVKEIIDDADFSIPSYKELFTVIYSLQETTNEEFLKDLINKLQSPLLDVLDTLLLTDISNYIDNKNATSIKQLCYRMKKLSIKKAMKILTTTTEDGDQYSALREKLAQVDKELNLL